MNNNKQKSSITITVFLAILTLVLIYFTVQQQSQTDQQSKDVANQVTAQVKEIILKRPTCADTSAEFQQLKDQGSYYFCKVLLICTVYRIAVRSPMKNI